ncbi:hypothetical protein KEJ36_02605 [Candidatus Bathyarchaeota archaeon]|nr:hypothetical protein [Candidatus Bathyarchaeota archaeon]MBS7627700.1 hypothetical protein [Candidatus Bathyarchaeota archaeon]
MPYVEPGEKVRRILFEAIMAIGMEKFLQEVRASREEVEDWLKGKGWVPLRTLLIACTIGRGRKEALERLEEVMEDLRTVSEPISKVQLEGPKPSKEASMEKSRNTSGKDLGRGRLLTERRAETRARAGTEIKTETGTGTEPKMDTEAGVDAEALRKRREMGRTFSILILKSTILVLSMFFASLAGYIIFSPFGTLYAGLGLLLPIVLGIIICLLWSLKARPS